MRVVAYEPRWRGDIQRICIETSPMKGSRERERYILAAYCNGYLDRGLCYVLLDGEDRPRGYILCAAECGAYRKYLPETVRGLPLFRQLMVRGEALGYARFAREYPAHLHIDILEEFTAQGGGTLLMNALLDQLRKREVRGIMLQAGPANHRAITFYKKQGFEVLRKGLFTVAMGKKL